MKIFFTFILILSVFNILSAQTIQEEHDQILVDNKEKQLVAGESFVLTVEDCPQCPKENKLEISLRIAGNKFSVYVKLGDKKLHEKSILSLKDKVGFMGTVQILGNKEQGTFIANFHIEKESGINLKENLSETFGKPSLEGLLFKSCVQVFPMIKANINTENYKPIILLFIEAQRSLFYTLLKPETDPKTVQFLKETLQTKDGSRWLCPNCGKDTGLGSGVKYCRSCYACYAWGIQKCPTCGSWQNGPAQWCKWCNYCWK